MPDVLTCSAYPARNTRADGRPASAGRSAFCGVRRIDADFRRVRELCPRARPDPPSTPLSRPGPLTPERPATRSGPRPHHRDRGRYRPRRAPDRRLERRGHPGRGAPRRQAAPRGVSAALRRKAGHASGTRPCRIAMAAHPEQGAAAPVRPRVRPSGSQRRATTPRGGFACRERVGTGCTRSPAKSRTHVRMWHRHPGMARRVRTPGLTP
jgi:hypothetical protein